MSGIGTDLLNSITGNVEPAYIVVHDFRTTNAAEDAGDTIFTATAAAAALSKGGDTAPGKSVSIIPVPPPVVASNEYWAVDKIFRVQYNPSELQIYSSSSVESVSGVTPNEEGETNTVAEAPLGGKMELSVTLWFDKMSAATSFMLEKNIMPTSVSGVTNIAKTFMKEDSVQDEVEGFVAALRNPHTQVLTLHWADFSFTGVLINVSAQYRMFSASGLPVRATVSLRVRQEAGGANTQRWMDDFETAFANDQSSLVRPEQKVSNLLNLGL
jgi:hypothetical protein